MKFDGEGYFGGSPGRRYTQNLWSEREPARGSARDGMPHGGIRDGAAAGAGLQAGRSPRAAEFDFVFFLAGDAAPGVGLGTQALDPDQRAAIFA